MPTLPQKPPAELPMGPRNRVRGVPKWAGIRVRILPQRPSVELPMEPRTVSRVCRNMGGEPRANFASEAFGGVPYGATNRVR
eukprot:6539324-Pyramimonas_sp.AAC.1